MNLSKFIPAFFIASVLAAPAPAQDALVTLRILSPDTALKLAKKALEACRKQGYQVAVTVVDRMGVPQVLLRDRFAGAHTPKTATRKAWTAVSFRTNTTELAAAAKPGAPMFGIHHVPGALILGGGVIVQAAGSTVGGVGVSGAPGGEADEACAKKGIEAISDDLNF